MRKLCLQAHYIQTTGYLVPDTCKQISWANIICDTFYTILIISNKFLKILSKFKLAFYYLINTCLKVATSRSCCTSRNFFIVGFFDSVLACRGLHSFGLGGGGGEGGNWFKRKNKSIVKWRLNVQKSISYCHTWKL